MVRVALLWSYSSLLQGHWDLSNCWLYIITRLYHHISTFKKRWHDFSHYPYFLYKFVPPPPQNEYEARCCLPRQYFQVRVCRVTSTICGRSRPFLSATLNFEVLIRGPINMLDQWFWTCVRSNPWSSVSQVQRFGSTYSLCFWISLKFIFVGFVLWTQRFCALYTI